MCVHAKLRTPGGSVFIDARWQARHGFLQAPARSKDRGESRARRIWNEGIKQDERDEGVLREYLSERIREGRWSHSCHFPVCSLWGTLPCSGHSCSYTQRLILTFMSVGSKPRIPQIIKAEKSILRGPQISRAVSRNAEWNTRIFKMQEWVEKTHKGQGMQWHHDCLWGALRLTILAACPLSTWRYRKIWASSGGIPEIQDLIETVLKRGQSIICKLTNQVQKPQSQAFGSWCHSTVTSRTENTCLWGLSVQKRLVNMRKEKTTVNHRNL